MDQIWSLIPADKLIHMTAAYSNALLLVVVTNVSDFAKRLDLPVPQPIAVSNVQKFFPHPIKDYIAGSITLDNGDHFHFDHGHISSYRSYNNFLVAPPDIENGTQERRNAWVAGLFGPMTITTNQVLQLARDAIRKLGYDERTFHVERPPDRLTGPSITPNGRTIPFCRVEWRDSDIVEIDINGHTKQIVGFSLISTNAWRADPKLGIVPELERDFRKRNNLRIFVRTNAPVSLPNHRDSQILTPSPEATNDSAGER